MTRPERITFPGTPEDAQRLELVVGPLGAKVAGADFPDSGQPGVVVVHLPDDPEQADQVRRALDQWRREQ